MCYAYWLPLFWKLKKNWKKQDIIFKKIVYKIKKILFIVNKLKKGESKIRKKEIILKKYISVFTKDKNGNTILNPKNPKAKEIYLKCLKIPKPILCKNKKIGEYEAFKEFLNEKNEYVRIKY